MTKKVLTVRSDETVAELLARMAKEHHVGYPVVNEKNEPVGEVTLEEAAQIDKTKTKETRVEQVMRKKLATVCPGETGLDVFRKMSQHETGRVLVVDPTNKNKILGIITKADLMDALTKHPPAA
jgi:predicted transcriptional regulator